MLSIVCLSVCLSYLKVRVYLLQTYRIFARELFDHYVSSSLFRDNNMYFKPYVVLIISYCFQTYTELLNMGKYDRVQYSKVEDLGAQDEPPSEQVKTSTTGKKLGKWSSVR